MDKPIQTYTCSEEAVTLRITLLGASEFGSVLILFPMRSGVAVKSKLWSSYWL